MGGKVRKEKASICRWVSDRVAGQALYSVTVETTYMTMPGINVEVNEVSELEQDMQQAEASVVRLPINTCQLQRYRVN